MRVIQAKKITETLCEMCGKANIRLSEDMEDALKEAYKKESHPVGKGVMEDIIANLKVAQEEQMPICQDTGTAVVFVNMGQDVRVEGGLLEDAIQEGVRQGYKKYYLRKSIVEHPIDRVNTKDNTPAIIHYQIVAGESLELTVAPKGGGSENMSRLYMLTPSVGGEGIKKVVLETVKLAGPNACLPMVVGIGIGGNFEKSALLAKKALIREIGSTSKDATMEKLERELLEMINETEIGPQGLGGTQTALGVHIEYYPCHIASMPVAINIGCHVNRHITSIL